MSVDFLDLDIRDLSRSGISINGGFFVFSGDIFDHLHPGEELVHEPFRRLIALKQLRAYPYGGFWASMDTFKDRQRLEDLHSRGESPWEVWRQPEAAEELNGVAVR